MNQGSCGAGYDFSSSEKGPQYPGVEGRHLTLGRPTESFPGGFVAGTGERERSWLHSMDKALLGEIMLTQRERERKRAHGGCEALGPAPSDVQRPPCPSQTPDGDVSLPISLRFRSS